MNGHTISKRSEELTYISFQITHVECKRLVIDFLFLFHIWGLMCIPLVVEQILRDVSVPAGCISRIEDYASPNRSLCGVLPVHPRTFPIYGLALMSGPFF